MPKQAPESSPSSAARVVHPRSSVATGRARSMGASSMTPAVLNMMANRAPALSGSPRNKSPKSAIWMTSVLV
jgi:hypothetical protein